MNKQLTWRVLKELNRLYREKSIKTKDYVRTHPYVVHLESFEIIHIEPKNRIIATSEYAKTYEQELEESYSICSRFIEQNNLERPYWDFLEKDIQTLIAIHEVKYDLVQDQWTKNQISSFYFRDEDAKYLRLKRTLSNAVLTILGLDEFPEDEKDQQYIHITHCYSKEPRAILLAENFDRLRLPEKYRKSDVELWYTGGRNTAKLAYIRYSESLPFYYICDWDYDGLNIYKSIKEAHLPSLKLIFPDNWRSVIKPIGKHKSKWREASFLQDPNFFGQKEQSLIKKLISEDRWIEEEAINFSFDQILELD